MILSQNYELVEIADEFLAIPVGEMAQISKDVFSFSKAGGLLLGLLREPKTEDDMVDYIVKEYDLDIETAKADVREFVTTIRSYGLISE